MLAPIIAFGLLAIGAFLLLKVEPHVILHFLPSIITIHLLLLHLVWHGKIPRVMGVLLLGAYVTFLVTVVLIE